MTSTSYVPALLSSFLFFLLPAPSLPSLPRLSTSRPVTGFSTSSRDDSRNSSRAMEEEEVFHSRGVKQRVGNREEMERNSRVDS